MLRRSVVTTALVALAAIGCSAGADAPSEGVLTAPEPRAEASGDPAPPPPDQAEPEPLKPSGPYQVVTVTLVSPDGATRTPLSVYDANAAPLRQFGLMHRTELPARAGMVFRYPDDRDGGFWMKNTLIPLSIAYFDAEGVVHTVLDMEPCTTEDCASYPPNASYRGALEVNQGFFAEVGLEPGWRVEVPADLPPAQA